MVSWERNDGQNSSVEARGIIQYRVIEVAYARRKEVEHRISLQEGVTLVRRTVPTQVADAVVVMAGADRVGTGLVEDNAAVCTLLHVWHMHHGSAWQRAHPMSGDLSCSTSLCTENKQRAALVDGV